ncbi:MAG: potassium channel family protein [Bacillota bacterium]
MALSLTKKGDDVMKTKQFLVIGAGRFGSSVARNLYKLGHDVMVMDNNEDKVQQFSEEVTNAVKADASSEPCLKGLDIKDFDTIVLAIGDDMQASIMAAILLIELGAKRIVAKARTELHGKVLDKVGVNQVVFPERDMGQKLARSLIAPTIIDLIELSDDYSVVEVNAPEEMVGKSLKELNLRNRYGISIIALRRNSGHKTIISPVAEDIIEKEDIIVAIGENNYLSKMEWI